MISLSRKTIVLRPVMGMSPGFALALVVCIIALGVFAAVMLDGYSQSRQQNGSPAQIAEGTEFQPPQTSIVRSSATDSTLPWLRNAVPFPAADLAPRMAIVVVDDGSDVAAALSAMRLPTPVTLAIAPTADAADSRAEAARRHGREVLLLLPMQAEETFDDSPNPIAIHVSHEELERRMKWNLAQIDGYVGVMNRYGEATTRDPVTMRAVLEIVQSMGLSFIDSRAHEESIAGAVARRMGIPSGDLVVAISEKAGPAEVEAQLNAGFSHAERWGTSIVTIPADRKMIAVLEEWGANVPPAVRFAPVTAVIKRLRSGKI